MENFWQDLRYGVRTLAKNPGFTVVAVLTLALGIGANTAIFSMVNAVLLRAIPFHDPASLVTVVETVGANINPVSYPDLQDWRKQNHVFSALSAYTASDFILSGREHSERVRGELVSANYFQLLGVAAAQGRTFLPQEDQKLGGAPVALLSDGAWKRRFGGDMGTVGRSIKVNEADFTVVGILPAGFQGYSGDTEVWIPLVMWDVVQPQLAQFKFLQSRDIHFHHVLGRLKPGVSLEAARAEMATIADGIAHQYGQANDARGAAVIAAREQKIGELRSPMLLLLGAVGFVLLIACANVANLLLVRAAGRERELALRAVLGASRGRLVRQLLVEGGLVTITGGLLGVLLAYAGLGVLVSVLPLHFPTFVRVDLSLGVLLFTSALTVITALVVGLAPALQAGGVSVNESLKEGARNSGSQRGHAFRRVLVVAELAIALVLMVGAGLMLKSLAKMLAVNPGFRADHLLTMRFDVPSSKYSGTARLAVGQRLLDHLHSVPGVGSAALTDIDPFVWSGIGRSFWIEGRPEIPPVERETVYFHELSPQYFATMGIPLLRGRDFTPADNSSGAPVVIVSETFARHFWPGENAVGKRMQYGGADSKYPWMEVIGVAGNMKFDNLRQDTRVESVVYGPLLQSEVIESFSAMVRTEADPASMIPALRQSISAFDADIPVYSVATMEDRLVGQAADTRSFSLLMGAFALLALFLSAIGIYGVMSYAVSRRVHDLGIRMALGAQPAAIRRLVLGEGGKLALAGLGIGLLAALAATRLLQKLLFDVAWTDPATFAGVAAVLALVTLAASYIPARRAMRVDPMVALRHE